MKIHYFIKDDSHGDWMDIKLEAWREDENIYHYSIQENGSSFTRIEKIRIFKNLKSDKVQSTSLEIDFGVDSAIGHNATNRKDFLKSETNGMFPMLSTGIDHYTEKRKEIFRAYQKEMFIDFQKVQANDDYSLRKLS